ncbi:MAG: hypothetical protein J07HB67_02640 [halophilic archaeon J07HB67]|nr:MAG: hypothetical protein J07HB67_02640 [halophilic archaeon J07HB67]
MTFPRYAVNSPATGSVNDRLRRRKSASATDSTVPSTTNSPPLWRLSATARSARDTPPPTSVQPGRHPGRETHRRRPGRGHHHFGGSCSLPCIATSDPTVRTLGRYSPRRTPRRLRAGRLGSCVRPTGRRREVQFHRQWLRHPERCVSRGRRSGRLPGW